MLGGLMIVSFDLDDTLYVSPPKFKIEKDVLNSK